MWFFGSWTEHGQTAWAVLLQSACITLITLSSDNRGQELKREKEATLFSVDVYGGDIGGRGKGGGVRAGGEGGVDYCWHQTLHTENIFWGINLCNVIDYTYIMKSSQELICVM